MAVLPVKSTALGLLERGATTKTTHQRPRSVPHAAFADALWVVFTARALVGQDSKNKGKSGSTQLAKETSDTFKFLAPNEIMENIGHDYDEYESMSTRVTQKVGAAKKAISETAGLAGGVKEGAKALVANKSAENISNAVTNAIGGSDVIYKKFDAALVYSGTQRREYQFLFNLIDEGNPRLDIIDVIKRLQRYSSPTATTGTGDKIIPPFVFELKTEPGSMILMPKCVLTAIQPTYRGPFRDGYPSICELTLTFRDMDPLYSTSDAIAATEVLSISSTLKKFIPGIDKFNKWQSVYDRAAASAYEHDKKYKAGEYDKYVDKGKSYIGAGT